MENLQTQATIVFKISRFDAKSNQLLMVERYNSRRDTVTSMGRVLFDNNFISGLHLAFINEAGETSFSFDRNSEMEGQYHNFNISLTEEICSKLLAEVKALPQLVKPAKNDEGVSTLKGYQLHVKLKSEDLEVYSPSEGNITLSVNADNVASVGVVTLNESNYVKTGKSVTMKASQVLAAFGSAREKLAEAPTNIEETQTFLKTMSRAQRRSAARKARKEQRSTELLTLNSDDSKETPTEPQVEAPTSIEEELE